MEHVSGMPHVIAREVRTPEDVDAALAEFSSQGTDLVVISAGDGTVQAVLTVLFHKRPYERLPFIAVLKGGTTNLIADDVGVPGDQSEAVKRLLDLDKAGGHDILVETRPVLRVDIPGVVIKYGMFLGAAGIYQGVKCHRRQQCRRGIYAYPAVTSIMVRLLLAGLIEGRGEGLLACARVSLDGHPLREDRFLLLLVTGLERLLFGMRPFWGEGRGHLHLVAAGARPRRLPVVLSLLLAGRRPGAFKRANGYYSINADRIEIETKSGIALDGEIYRPDPTVNRILIEYGGRAAFLRW